MDSRNEKWKSVSFSTKATKGLLSEISISFLQRRKIAYIVSSVLIFISLASLTFQGLNQGVDFVGGRSYTVRFENAVNPTEISSVLNNEFGSAEVKTFGEENQLKITTKYKVDVEGVAVDEEIHDKLFTSLQPYLPDWTTYESFVKGSS